LICAARVLLGCAEGGAVLFDLCGAGAVGLC
jgi:hypothetical protein